MSEQTSKTTEARTSSKEASLKVDRLPPPGKTPKTKTKRWLAVLIAIKETEALQLLDLVQNKKKKSANPKATENCREVTRSRKSTVVPTIRYPLTE